MEELISGDTLGSTGSNGQGDLEWLSKVIHKLNLIDGRMARGQPEDAALA